MSNDDEDYLDYYLKKVLRALFWFTIAVAGLVILLRYMK